MITETGCCKPSEAFRAALGRKGFEAIVSILATGRIARPDADDEPAVFMFVSSLSARDLIVAAHEVWRENVAPPFSYRPDFIAIRADSFEKGALSELAWSTFRADAVGQATVAAEEFGISITRDSDELSGARTIAAADSDGKTDRTKLSDFLDSLLRDVVPVGLRPVAVAKMHAIVPFEFKPLVNIGCETMSAEKRAERPDAAYDKLRAVVIGAAADNSDPKRGYVIAPDNPAAANYFLPHIHKLLAPSREHIRELLQGGPGSRKAGAELDEHMVSIEFTPADLILKAYREGLAAPIKARLTRLRLHFYAARTLALEWSLAPIDEIRERGKDRPFWAQLIDASPRTPTVAAWMDAVEVFRIVYSAFAADPEEVGKAACVELLRNREPVAKTSLWSARDDWQRPYRAPIVGICKFLLTDALGALAHCHRQQGDAGHLAFEPLPEHLEDWFEIRTDDRARMVHALVPCGDPPKSSAGSDELEAIQARLRTGERYGRSHAYDPDFSRNELKRGAYDRYLAYGSRYVVSDHCFGFIGFGSFAAAPIARDHMPNIYRRMFLLQLMNAAVLNGIEREMAEALEGWTPDADHDEGDEIVRAAYGRLEPRFAKFVNVNWFERVSSQMQGVELFDLLRQETRIDDEFALVSEEIGRTDRYLARLADNEELAAQRRAQESRDWLIVVGSFAAGVVSFSKVLSDTSAPSVAAAINWLVAPLGLPVGSLLEWKFEIASAASALLLAFLMGIGAIRAPGANHRMRPSIPLVAFSLACTFGIPLLLTPIGADPPNTPIAARLGVVVATAALVAMAWWSSRPMITELEGRVAFLDWRRVRESTREFWKFLTVRGNSYDFLVRREELAALRSVDRHNLRALRRAWILFGCAGGAFVCVAGLHAVGLSRVAEVMKLLSAAK